MGSPNFEVWKYEDTPSAQPRLSEDTVLETGSSAPFVVPTSSSCGELVVAFGHSPWHPLMFLPRSLLARDNIRVKGIPMVSSHRGLEAWGH